MKKSFLMLGAALAALTSCTQSEVLDMAQSKQISFDTFVSKNTRVAADKVDIANDDAFNSFYVYCAKGTKPEGTFTEDEQDGSHYMDGVAVSRTDKNSPWTYSPAKEWIISKYYRFAAYSNGHKGVDTTDGEDNTTVNTDNKLDSDVTFFSDQTVTVKAFDTQGEVTTHSINNVWGLSFDDYEASDRDLIAATSMERNTATSNSGQRSVNFTFAHMLAKVQFKFTYSTDDTEHTRVYIKPFTINAIKTADCDIFHYDYAEGKDTYVNWNSQFELPSTDATEMSTGNYEYFPSTTPITLGGSDYATEITSGTAGIFYNNYVIPQKNTFNIGGIEVLIYKDDVLNAHYTYNNISLGIADHEYWKPGYVYRYEAELNANKQYIQFTANVHNWEDTPDRDAVIGGDITTTDDEGNN